MAISAEKTKLMINIANGIQRDIKVKEQWLGTVTSFKYLGAVVSDDGSKLEILSRIAQATVGMISGDYLCLLCNFNWGPISRNDTVSKATAARLQYIS